MGGDEKKATGLFWIVLQKPGSVFTGWEKGWAQGHGACSLLQRCLVCHLTLECCTVPVPPPLPPPPCTPPPPPPPCPPPLSPAQQTDPVIFSIWKILGVTDVSVQAEARSGFSYKQVHRLYLNRQWHLTPKTLVRLCLVATLVISHLRESSKYCHNGSSIFYCRLVKVDWFLAVLLKRRERRKSLLLVQWLSFKQILWQHPS